MRSNCKRRWGKAVRSRASDALVNAALLAWAFACGTAQSAEPAQTHSIAIENMKFVPEELVVKQGSRVRWVNQDLVAHTATAEAFDSGNIESNASWLYVATKPGVYSYVCALHPTMQARLIVQ